MNPLVWRIIAVAIAIAAFIDPGFTRQTSTRPIVSVVAATPRDMPVAEDVRDALRNRFTVVDGVLPGAAASVVVGDHLPASFRELASPAFAVTDDASARRISLASVTAPRMAALNSRVRVDVITRTSGMGSDSVALTLFADDAVLDRATVAAATGGMTSGSVWFVPASAGVKRLRVTAEAAGARLDEAGLVVDVRDDRWSVLFFDRRPSWMSTFVRRAIERDPRFRVTSRVVTSRGVSTDAGQPPESFDALTAGDGFDAVVIGAPELLTDRDVAGLDAFMRRRGGSVVMLFDTRLDGRYERLTQVQRWSIAADSAVLLTTGEPASGSLRAGELAWPAVLPAGAERIVSARSPRDASQRPIVWRSSIGAGRLIVSGALDAWTYRDTSSSKFDEFWRHTIAEAAAATPSGVMVRIPGGIATPDSRMEIEAVVRGELLAQASADSASLAATIESGGSGEAIRLWPAGEPGVYRAEIRAPGAEGIYRVTTTSGSSAGAGTFVVARTAAHTPPDDHDLLAGWVGARNGRLVARNALDGLGDALREAIDAVPLAERWHPMRSAWWIVPFALALGAEWWWRRRRGLA